MEHAAETYVRLSWRFEQHIDDYVPDDPDWQRQHLSVESAQ
jgi:hypothetical protein